MKTLQNTKRCIHGIEGACYVCRVFEVILVEAVGKASDLDIDKAREDWHPGHFGRLLRQSEVVA